VISRFPRRSMAIRSLVVCALALVGVVAVTVVRAAPEPDPVPRRWEFRIEPGDLRLTCVSTQDEGPRAYFYMTYTVTNTTGQDRFFAPRFELATDNGDVIRSGKNVPPEVSDELIRRIDNPFLKSEIDVQGLLLQGEEYRRDGLVVWRADDLLADEISVYAAGFSGETRTIERPDNGEPILLRKTLMLRHATPGDLDCRDDRALQRVTTRWIMR